MHQHLDPGFTELPNMTVTGSCHILHSLVSALSLGGGLGLWMELQTLRPQGLADHVTN